MDKCRVTIYIYTVYKTTIMLGIPKSVNRWFTENLKNVEMEGQILKWKLKNQHRRIDIKNEKNVGDREK